MPAYPLDGVNVLDLSQDIGGSYCTKLLADLGATVLMVEPPGGHPLRQEGPFADGQPDPEKSGLFVYYNCNKHSIVLDLERPQDRARLLELSRDADIVVESFAPGRMAQLGLDYEALRAGHAELVMTSVTSFGQTGRWRDWQGEEIVSWALSGYLYFGGDPGREPLMVHNNQALLHAGSHAAYASLVALWSARKAGEGQYVDVSAFEAMLTAHIWTTTQWTQEGLVMRRMGSDLLRCRDGWIHIMPLGMNPDMFVLIDRPELMDEERFLDPARWPETQVEIMGMLAEWCKDRPKEEVWRKAQELHIAGAPAFDARDLTEAENLKARDFFLTVDHPKAGQVVMPGFPYKFGETPLAVRRPAPLLGQDGQGWPSEARNRPAPTPVTLDRAPIVPASEADKTLPLRGVRVLEVTNNWAGPVAGRNLSDLGAEVIKVESPTRLAARSGHFTGLQPFRYHYNRCSYDNKMNRGKYGVTLDLTQPEGRDLFLRLVKEADVVIENNSPRVMRNVNLGYDVLREVNPKIIMAQIAAYGQTGPLRDFIAYGANIEAACGLAAVTGYQDDERPYRTGYYYADPVTATHASAAIVAALLHREKTGEGQHIDLSLQENGIAFFPEAMLEYTMTGRLASRRGNRHKRHAPQGCYPSIGDDMWMVLTIRGDEEWGRFVGVVGDERLRDPRFGTEQGRMAHHDELDGLIAEWSRQYDHHEASRLLQESGIPAAPVLANWEMVSNLHAHDRGFYVVVPHKEMGAFPFPGIVWKLSATPGSIRMPCPLFGEHNQLVVGEFLGLSDREIAGLAEKRVIADEPPEEFMTPPVMPGAVPAPSPAGKESPAD